MRVFLLVIDSFGIGYLPNAAQYGDVGANTAANIGTALGKVNWPNLQQMGLGNAAKLVGREIPGCAPLKATQGLFGAMQEMSPGKDTTAGHWEMAGIVLKKPFHIFPAACPCFPDDLIQSFIKESGIPGILGNKAASGTEIIDDLGEDHLKTGKPICYTSADSVFQIACHKDVFSIEQLYRLCEIARKLCDSINVGRVIARPFDGKPGAFQRTKERHDWSIDLPGLSLLDHLQSKGVETVAVGKIGSIFNEQGIDVSYHDSGNPACLARTLDIASAQPEKDQFVFINLVDTDMIYGHRRDPQGYHDAVAAIDSALPGISDKLAPGDVLAVAADHGCDPTYRGTDHTREHVPVLFRTMGTPARPADMQSVGVRSSFADLSASIQEAFRLEPLGPGAGFTGSACISGG